MLLAHEDQHDENAFRFHRNMKISNWLDLMELLRRKVTLTMKWSHNDLAFILIGGKKFFVKNWANVVGKRGSQQKRKGKKKISARRGYFFKELQQRLEMMQGIRRWRIW